MSLILRGTKGAALTHAELDNNQIWLRSRDIVSVSVDLNNNLILTKDDSSYYSVPLSGIIGDGFNHQIGEYVSAEGGVIYHRYMEGTTQKYLVVDTQDLGQDVWSNIDNVLIGPSAQSRWNGSGNTTSITSQSGATTGAAFLCVNSSNNGQNDWYLPSIGELVKIWGNQYEVSKGLEDASGNWLNPEYYWSSTEYDNDGTFGFFFNDSVVYPYSKNSIYYVRAVRQFSI